MPVSATMNGNCLPKSVVSDELYQSALFHKSDGHIDKVKHLRRDRAH